MPPIEFGLVLPPLPDVASLASTLRYVDGAPFDTVWVPDRTLADTTFLDALTVLGALSLATSRVRIGPASLVASRRNPVLTAHALATANYLSGGRLVVGVGVSGIEPNEFAVAGVDPQRRGTLTDEYMGLWRRLWSEDDVDHEGAYACRGVTIGPRPDKPIPVWIAGNSPAANRRAGRLGDGWLPCFVTPARYPGEWATVGEVAAAEGRDPGAIVPGVYLFGAVARRSDDARAVLDGALQAMLGAPLTALADSCVVGTPAEWVEQIERWKAAGARHVSVLLFTGDLDSDVRIVGEEVLPVFAA